MITRIEKLTEAIAAQLIERGQMMGTVESCTAGGIAFHLSHLPGSSEWFESGFVTYSNLAKMQMVGVREETLAEYGAVSEPVAAEMALGGLSQLDVAHCLSVTGIAGPGGGTADKPVGMVCFAWAKQDADVVCETRFFHGDRMAVRMQTILHSLDGCLRRVIEG